MTNIQRTWSRTWSRKTKRPKKKIIDSSVPFYAIVWLFYVICFLLPILKQIFSVNQFSRLLDTVNWRDANAPVFISFGRKLGFTFNRFVLKYTWLCFYVFQFCLRMFCIVLAAVTLYVYDGNCDLQRTFYTWFLLVQQYAWNFLLI